jgi:PAS domain S-box-containing protein
LNSIIDTLSPAFKSETGKLIQSIDWSLTSLGPLENWPQSLITSINICLSSRFPMSISWGKDLIHFYNDAYKEIIGSKHPSAFGAKSKDIWSEIWHIVGTLLEDEVMKKGKSTLSENQLLILNRKGYAEECYFTFSYSPLYDETNQIHGVFCTCQETTHETVNQRHLSILQLLSKRISDSSSLNDIFINAAEIAGTSIHDFPFTVMYLIDDETCAKRIAFSGIDQWHELESDRIDLNRKDQVAGFIKEAIHSGDMVSMQHDEVHGLLPGTPGKGVNQSLLFPIIRKGKEMPVGILVIGMNPYLKLINPYLHFLRLFVDQLQHEVNLLINLNENKIVEKKLRESEDHYRLATEVTQLATWDLNLQTFELIHSPRLAEILGYDSKTVLTHQMMHDRIHPEDLYPVVERAFDTALETAEYNYDSRIIWPDKSLHWIRTQGKVLYDDKNIPIRMLGIMTDITELKNAEQALRESEKRFRMVADTAPVMIWMADRDRKCIFLNKCWSEFTGMPISDGLRDWTKVVHPDDLPQTAEKFSRAYETHSVYTQELRLRNKHGEYIWVMDHAVPRYSAEGFFMGYIGSSINIHEQKNAKQELENRVRERTLELNNANEELRKTNKELEQFAYVSSHDLQEPLRKIQTFSELLYNKIDESQKTERTYIEKIRGSAIRMSDLIRDLLNLSKLSNVDEEFVKTDLSQIMENVKADFEVLIQQKNAQLEIAPLPVIKAIPIQINQLFYNLMSNALKFTEKTPEIKVMCSEVSAEELKSYNLQGEIKDKSYVKITFVDNGVGFEQSYADQIFVIFQRLNDRSKFTGTGIGLAICKKIVENHNGFITAKSKINEGSVFEIFLPK